VIVDAHVRQVRRHAIDHAIARQLEELALAGGIELQHRGAELEPLRPFGPATGAVLALDGEHWRAVLGPPARLERSNLGGRPLEQPLDVGHQVAGLARAIDSNHGGMIGESGVGE
jgi:hypothetical protein